MALDTPSAGASATAPASKAMLWAGWVISALVALLLMTGVMLLAKPPAVVEGLTKMGYDPQLAVALGIVEIACAIIYIIPRTAVLGAILVTGYLGGATATHVRVGESQFVMPVVVGMLAWFGLFLRDARIRALIPLRR